MSKKHWISIKRGLSEDPKHRERMGMTVWAFMHMIDRADWETGIVFDWKDKDEAEDMGVKENTLRDWRQRLESLGYISCKQVLHGQEITIFNWTNPKNYSGEVVNPKGDVKTSPYGDVHGSVHGDVHLRGENVTPTYSSESKNQKPNNNDDDALKELSSLYESNIGPITPLTADLLRNASLDYPVDWFKPAIEIAVKSNARRWAYVEAILDGWKRNGYGWKPGGNGSGKTKVTASMQSMINTLRSRQEETVDDE